MTAGSVPSCRLASSQEDHYRRGLIKLLDVLAFRSGNTAYQPVIEALALIRRYAEAGNITYYPVVETVPVHRGLGGDWQEVAYRADKRGHLRVVRMVYVVATFQALRDQLRCKEIWVVGADRWRNPDDDLPADFAERRAENYRELRKPLDPAVFVEELREQMRTELTALNEQLPQLGWVEITERRSEAIKLTPVPAQPEPSNLRRVKAEVLRRWGSVPLVDMHRGIPPRLMTQPAQKRHPRTPITRTARTFRPQRLKSERNHQGPRRPVPEHPCVYGCQIAVLPLDTGGAALRTMQDMTSAEHSKALWRRRIVEAKLLGIEHSDLVDRAVAEAESEEHLGERLRQPPFGLDGFEAEAVLSMQVRDRSPRAATRLRLELAALDEVIAKSERGGPPG